MTVARLHALLAHHPPDDAFAVAAGRAGRPRRRGDDASADRDGVAGLGGAPRSGDVDDCVSRPRASSPSRLATTRSRIRCASIRSRRRCCSSAATSTSWRSTRRHRRHAQRHPGRAGHRRSASAGRSPRPGSRSCRGSPRASTALLTAARWPADGRPVAVVGNGPDRPYPRVHAELWADVCSRGVLLSEWPPGTHPSRSGSRCATASSPH